mmetsp:Transcript_23571/g.23765  ORF Transcript_23571/g.23765 Transcript_23571/m.23765 type:complete len:357 (+) Transcript_23571:288-1358(+)|eukprot:CAMPEP_0182424336 /NCGR_PEP_ID=MMETSP1167-20130531/10532_1 /TAXON_ID=2988 /ORGANISM="Mallomonas Sp, Strain CCMP3275" /LENGTH=356 /DNA_ID=CAMNT_0024604077 /DNA_START=278 /DNA_END=1348 /DNA_ORIENTATION=-
MTSRRERQPSGRSNLSAREESLAPIKGPETSRQNSSRQSKQLFSPILKKDLSSNSPSDTYRGATDTYRGATDTYRGNATFTSTGAAVMRQLKEKQLEMNESRYAADRDRLGPYNTFSRSVPSRTTAPLRTVLLDPEVNNIVPSKTRTQLLERVRGRCAPHDSYDVDGDGWVSQEDFSLAKRFDLDNNGVLDPEERKLTKQVVVEDFLTENDRGLRALGALGGRSRLIENTLRDPELNSSLSLPQTISALHQAKFALRMSTRELMGPADYDEAGTRTQRYFTNKFDATAWNDYDTVPRFTSSYGLDDHGGSRRRLLFSRKQKHSEDCQSKLEKGERERVRLDARRHCLITNPAVENS